MANVPPPTSTTLRRTPPWRICAGPAPLHRGGGVYTGIISLGKISWEGNFATVAIPTAPNCLTHTLMCKPMLLSQRQKDLQIKVTESSIGS